MEEDMKGRHIPEFGHWDYCDGFPITQYFESAWHTGLVSCRFWEEDEDLFKVPAPAKPAFHHVPRSHHRKVSKGGVGKEKQVKVSEVSNQRTPRRQRVPKAVDEDLYKIPSELVFQRPKKKRLLRNLLSGCLSLNCIA